MSEEIEDALRKLRPIPVEQGALLIAMGRASPSPPRRNWGWLAALMSTVAAGLAGVLLLRPAPTERIVYVPVAAVPAVAESRVPVEEGPKRAKDSESTDEIFGRHHLSVHLQPISEDGDNEPVGVHPPLQAGDALRETPAWRTFKNSGVQ